MFHNKENRRPSSNKRNKENKNDLYEDCRFIDIKTGLPTQLSGAQLTAAKEAGSVWPLSLEDKKKLLRYWIKSEKRPPLDEATRAKEIIALLTKTKSRLNSRVPSEQPKKIKSDQSNKKQKTSDTQTVAPVPAPAPVPVLMPILAPIIPIPVPVRVPARLYFFGKQAFYVKENHPAKQQQPKVLNPLEQLAELALQFRA